MRAVLAMLLMALGWVGMARAAEPEPACFAPPHTFDGARPVAAARTLGGGPHPMLTLGEPAHVGLVEARTFAPVVPLGKPVATADATAGRAGLVWLHVPLTGTYRIALGGKAWIDMVAKGASLDSVAHAHGAPCTGIAKQVDFTLAPGDYMIQLTGAQVDAVDVVVTKLG